MNYKKGDRYLKILSMDLSTDKAISYLYDL